MLKHLKEFKATLKAEGFRGVLKKYRWKLLLPILVYYLIRDTFLYIVVPYFLVKSLQ